MTIDLTDVVRVRIAQSMLVIAFTFGAMAVAIQSVVDIGALYEEWIIHNAGGAILLAALAWPMVKAKPRNNAVWIFPWIAVFQGLNALGSAVLTAVVAGRGLPVDLVGSTMADLGWFGAIALNLETWAWLPGITPIVTFALLWFPDGQALSARWKPVGWLALGSTAALSWLLFWPFRPVPDVVIRAEEEAFSGELVAFSALGLGLSIVLSIISLATRYRRSRGLARRRFRWIAWSSSTTAALWLAANIYDAASVGSPGNVAFQAVSLVSLPVFFGGYAVAIWRHQLFDVDVVISRTVLFGSLALFIGAMYVGIVSGLGRLIGQSSDDQGLSLAATIVVALLFHPVRQRLEHGANRLVYGRRTTPYEVLADLSSRLNRAEAVDGLLDRMVMLLAEGTGAEQATVWLLTDSGYIPVAVWPAGTSVPSAATFSEAHMVPIERAGTRLGGLTVKKRRSEELAPTERRLVDDLAGSIGLILDKARLDAALGDQAEALFESRRRLVDAQHDERHRLEQQLNSGIQRRLAELAAGLAAGADLAAEDGVEKVADQLLTLADQARMAQDEIRALALGIYPPLLDAEGLTAAIEDLARSMPLPVAVDSTVTARLDPEIELAVYFSVAEALTNTIKHANASQITVQLGYDADGGPGVLRFTVNDDGLGFRPGLEPGTGLAGIRDRIEAVEGQLMIASEPGQGVTVSGSVVARQLTTVE